MTAPIPDDVSQVVPGQGRWPGVIFRGLARPEPAAWREQLERELAYVFGRDRDDVDLVLVIRRYEGYAVSDDKIVFGVELRLRGERGYETHIVKIGSEAKAGRDADRWEACTRGREVASRIFASIRKVPIPGGRAAVLYRDAYTLFGPGDDDHVAPRNLETIAEEAVFKNTVDPESVEKAVAHIFTDLSLWFFHGARPDAGAARAFYREELSGRKRGERVNALDIWRTDADRLALRRDALWLFCGRDRPDADHRSAPARYLDPVELVAWALDAGRLPETRVGRAHGDLHGRNILLGVRRSAAQYPAVFDYGGMGESNVLAWDFAKLETELKVRLLQRLYYVDKAHAAVRLRRQWTWGDPPERKDTATHRAERLRFYCIFEEMLAEATEWITNKHIAEAWRPPGGRTPTGVEEVDRLFALILRVRQEAALALGFAAKPVDAWRDELYFALAVCGLVNARWETYTAEEAESALVSAGVAAAHAAFARAAVAESCAAATLPDRPFPSYRVPLAHARRLWKPGRHHQGMDLLDGVMAEFRHAAPLIAERALFRCEVGDFASVRTELNELQAKAIAFHDEEMLTRLGRAFKEMGDRSWEDSRLPFDRLGGHPSVQFYRLALEQYELAYGLRNHYFPGANVAATALLSGQAERAEAVAADLLAECADIRKHPQQDHYWVLATEGDASLILRRGEAAREFYRNALYILANDEQQFAVSSYRQLARLRGPLGRGLVDPVLQLFEEHPVVGPALQQMGTRRLPG